MLINNFMTPIGVMQVTIENGFIISLTLDTDSFVCEISTEDVKDNKVLKELIKQIDQYFKKQRTIFDLPLLITGTYFQKKVYNAVLESEYGKTYSYKDIASLAGFPNAYRAVGTAMKNNNLALVIPCHRVIKASGKLGKYFNEDSQIKIKLLLLEGDRKK